MTRAVELQSHVYSRRWGKVTVELVGILRILQAGVKPPAERLSLMPPHLERFQLRGARGVVLKALFHYLCSLAWSHLRAGQVLRAFAFIQHFS
mmetsp:Transcript_48826/g.153324  ORF Transcript_48826/g.153324 Transcript_48826/m.153324 type:complete len:93 (+) Transcript_48826:1543-1821(+)